MNSHASTELRSSAAAGRASQRTPISSAHIVDERFQSLAKAFRWFFNDARSGGGALAVYWRGELVVDIWGGWADHSRTVPWDRNTAALIMSASKGLTSIVVHRLADRGLIDHDAPVAEHWPAFGRNGKGAVTVRQILNHTAGLSQLTGISNTFDELLDHELMEERLAAAPPDRLAGRPAYHGLTIGWLLAGLARAVTGKDMRQLYHEEIAEPLGLDGLHLGRPPAEASAKLSPFFGSLTTIAARRPAARIAGFAASALAPRTPTIGWLYGGNGMARFFSSPENQLYDTQMGAGNAVATARSLAKVYAPLSGDGSFEGKRFLSAELVRSFPRKLDRTADRALLLPAMWHMGFHGMPMPRLHRGFGHIGLGGSFGWADPEQQLSIALVHNRMGVSLLDDQGVFLWAIPLALRAAARASKAA